ncbi:MAG: imidazolonepropionase [Gammaproteobacteria bacterium]|nr:MAG: imidazolonepropionase [Gammaproteobacteria bacterium]
MEDNCDILFTGSHLFTAQGNEQQTIRNGALAVKDNIIVWLGEQSQQPERYKNPKKAYYELDQGWLTPGLIDCHTHLIYGGNRSDEFRKRMQGQSYEEIARQGGGILSTVSATRKASEETLLVSAARRLETLLNEGVTRVEIKSGYGLDLKTEIKMLEVARQLGESFPIDISTTLLAAHALPPEFKGQADAYIDHVCDVIMPAVAEANLADMVDGFCESIGFSAAQMERVFNKAQSLNLPVKLHAEQLSNQQGAKLAATYQALSADHLEYLDEDGVKAMAQSGTVAVLLPGAFYFLRETKLPPIELLRKHQVPMAIATDCNPGSSPCTSLLLMLNMACTQFNMTTDEALMAVTSNAAKALGLQDKVGQLKVGMQADLVHWSIDEPEDLAYYFGHNPCRLVVKDGLPILS